jgi:hypothetical protein
MIMISHRPSDKDAPYSVDTAPIRHNEGFVIGIDIELPMAEERSGIFSSDRELASLSCSNLEPAAELRLAL